MSDRSFWCERAYVAGAVHDSVAITVTDGRFGSIEFDATPLSDGATVSLPGLTLPGLANTHSHVFHRALRGRSQLDRGSFWTWRELMYRAAACLHPETAFRLARATFAEMALSGVTAVGEFHYVHHQPDGTPYDDPNEMGTAILQAAAEAGVRITLLDTLYLHGGLTASGHAPLDERQRRFGDGSAESWIERVEAIEPAAGQRVGAAIHSVRAVDPAAMHVVAAWAAERGVPLHAHVSEQPAENEQCEAAHGVSPIKLLRDAGALSDRFTAVHATHVSSDDVTALAASGATVCICPTTERDLADGIGPTTGFAGAGVPLALGSDSHAVIDLFEEARALELDERLRSGRRGVHDTASLLHAATVAGHRSLGWDDAGAIAVGARADLVSVALDSVRTAGAGDGAALEAAVFAATASDVTDVIVDGRHVVADGRHSTLDVAQELAAAIAELFEEVSS